MKESDLYFLAMTIYIATCLLATGIVPVVVSFLLAIVSAFYFFRSLSNENKVDDLLEKIRRSYRDGQHEKV